MDAVALHTHARAHGVDAVVIRLDGHFSPLAGHTHNVAYGDETVVDLRYLGLEQTLQEYGRSTRQDDDGVVVLQFHLEHDGAHRVALAEAVGGYLLALGQHQLYLLLVEHQYLLVPRLVDLANDYLAHFVLVFLEDERLLIVLNLAHQVLVYGQNLAAAELAQRHGLRKVLADLEVRFYLDSFGILNLAFAVCQFAVLDDKAVAVNLPVALVNVDNDVEVVVRAVFLGKGGAEHLFKDVHQSLTVNVLEIFKFRKGINKV